MKWLLRRLIIGVLAIALLGGGTWYVNRHLAHAEYDAALADWIAQGGAEDSTPFTRAAVPDSENGAIEIVQAYEIFDGAFRNIGPEFEGDPYTARLPEFDEARALVHAAADKQIIQWAPYIRPRFVARSDLTWHWTACTSLSYLLDADTRVCIDRGDAEGALRNLRSMRFLGDSFVGLQSKIDHLMAMGMWSMMIDAIRTTPADRLLPDAALRALLQVPAFRSDARQSMLGAGSAMIMDLFHPAAERTYSVDRAQFRRRLANFVREELAALKSIDQPWHVTLSNPPTSQGDNSVQVSDVHLRFIRNIAIGERMFILANTALDIRQHGVEHGSYPEAWPMPNDAVTGVPLQYERTDTGYRVWAEDPDSRLRYEFAW